ncbi:MAG TPA: ABC transporter permease [Mycobacteriales bacterium]|nr:ABC transporter permease [Mycobacteriales bacterium]
MSAADTGAPARADTQRDRVRTVASAGPAVPRSLRMRLVRSELGMVFRRRRNQVVLVVLTAVPVLIAVAVRVSGGPDRRGGGGPPLFDQITHNGIFVAFSALVAVMPFFLPLAVAVVSGDGIAGEASLGTLRYLLAVPVSRTRLLAVKYAGVVAYCLAGTLAVAAAGAVIGLALFGSGSAALLSGTPVGLAGGLWRLLLVSLYVGACMAGLGAIGLFVSTLVEAPVAAIASTAGVAIASEILDSVPQISGIHPYLPSHYWLAFGDLLRDPISTSSLGPGLVSIAVYAVLFLTLAWARFSGKDVSS